jgi:glutaredoxin
MLKRYLFFMTPMCPNCAELHEHMAGIDLPGDEIDATDDQGMELAQKWEVMSVPTIIFINQEGREQARASDMDEVKRILLNKSLLDV